MTDAIYQKIATFLSSLLSLSFTYSLYIHIFARTRFFRGRGTKGSRRMEFRAHLEILQTHPLLSAAKTVERIEITVSAFFLPSITNSLVRRVTRC